MCFGARTRRQDEGDKTATAGRHRVGVAGQSRRSACARAPAVRPAEPADAQTLAGSRSGQRGALVDCGTPSDVNDAGRGAMNSTGPLSRVTSFTWCAEGLKAPPPGRGSHLGGTAMGEVVQARGGRLTRRAKEAVLEQALPARVREAKRSADATLSLTPEERARPPGKRTGAYRGCAGPQAARCF